MQQIDKIIKSHPEYVYQLISRYSDYIDNYDFTELWDKTYVESDDLKQLIDEYASDVKYFEPRSLAWLCITELMFQEEGFANIVNECIKRYDNKSHFSPFKNILFESCDDLHCASIPKGFFANVQFTCDFHVYTKELYAYSFSGATFGDFMGKYDIFIEEGCTKVGFEAFGYARARIIHLPASLEILEYQTLRDVDSIAYSGTKEQFIELMKKSQWRHYAYKSGLSEDKLDLRTEVICSDGMIKKGFELV